MKLDNAPGVGAVITGETFTEVEPVIIGGATLKLAELLLLVLFLQITIRKIKELVAAIVAAGTVKVKVPAVVPK